jgi:hypothetical protein
VITRQLERDFEAGDAVHIVTSCAARQLALELERPWWRPALK